VAQQQEWWNNYGPWLAGLYPDLWKEISNMASKRGRAIYDWGPAIEDVGLRRLLEMAGFKKVIDEIGTKKFVEEIGTKQVLEEIEVTDLLASLTPEKRRELDRLMHPTR
jgi:hypothetical protein